MSIETMVSEGGLADISQRPTESNRERLLADLNAIVTDAELLLRQTADLSLEAYGLARVGLEAKLKETRQKLARLTTVVNEKSRRAAEATAAYVGEHPGKSISLALASGVVVGLAIGKLRD